jgi:3-oxoacyl-[acyl-carrier protein] reductase
MTGPPDYPPGHGLLQGRTVLVTAAAGTGIGFATAKRCAEEGAVVAISDKHERRLADAAGRLGEVMGSTPVAVPCDVTVQADVQRLFETVINEFDHLDVLVNNAGLGGTATLVDTSDEQWDAIIGVTLTGTFRCTRAAFQHMLPRRSGVIVNNASVSGWRAQDGQGAYSAAKAGVMALTRCAAMEGAPAGVRVNAVAPSLALHENLSKVIDAAALEELRRREAFGRSAETWEVANVIVFLASAYASYLTGEVISVSSQHP